MFSWIKPGTRASDASGRPYTRRESKSVLGSLAVVALGQGYRHLINWTSGRLPTVEYLDLVFPSMAVAHLRVSYLWVVDAVVGRR